MKYFLWCLLLLSYRAGAQVQSFSIEQCVDYALANAPSLADARLQDSLARISNEIALSAWKPTVSVDAGLTNNWKQQVSLFPDFMNPGETNEVVLGQAWTSRAGLTLSQLAYSPEVIRDRNLSAPRVLAAQLEIERLEIELEASVRRAFYRALRFQEQVILTEADIQRLERNLRDARLLFDNGLNDKVDYKRATIALNRSRAELGTSLLQTDSRLKELAALIGYPEDTPLTLTYDYEEFASTVEADSLVADRPVRQRIEIRQILVGQQLQDLSVGYLRQAWLPTVGVSAGYAYNWQAASFGSLYDRTFPAGLASMSVNVPLFTGGRRFRQIELATVERLGLDYQLADLELLIDQERQVAENDYRAARIRYRVAVTNQLLSREIYDVVLLQYREGLEPFLEVVIAETDLQTARNAALSALFDALIARVDLQRANGNL